MNRRQRKKKSKQEITVFIGCDKEARAEDYRKMKESIEYQLRAGSAVLLPAYLHVEAIIQQPGSRRIEIKQEREVKQNELQAVEKRYKKLHGVNPPLELDKRKQRRLAKRAVKTISSVNLAEVATRAAEVITNAAAAFMRGLGGAFDSAGTVCRNVADNIQPLEIKGRIFSWEVRKYGSSHYAVYEINALGGADELRAVTHSERAAEKIAEIMESDHLEYIGRVSPEKIKRRNDAADSLRAAVITAYESGRFAT